MTLADWHNAMWIVVFIWQFAWLLYALTTLCRTGTDGYLYCRPHYMPTSVYIIFILNNALIVTWTLLFDRKEMVAAVVIAFFVTITAVTPLILSLRGLSKYETSLQLHGSSSEVWWVRFTVHNGLALLTNYALIITMANLALVLVYEVDVDDWPTDSDWPEDAVTICLGILAFHFVLITALDLTVLDSYSRYIFTPYIAHGWAAVAILEKNWKQGTRNNMLILGLMGAVLMGFVLKFTTVLWRFITDRDKDGITTDQKVKFARPSQAKATPQPQYQLTPVQVRKVERVGRRSTTLAPLRRLRRSTGRHAKHPYASTNKYHGRARAARDSAKFSPPPKPVAGTSPAKAGRKKIIKGVGLLSKLLSPPSV